MPAIIAINYQTGKLWRFLQFPLVRIVLAAGSVIGIISILQIVAQILQAKSGSVANYLLGVVLIIGICGIYAGYVRLIEKRAASEFSGHGAVTEFGSGLLVGSLLFCVVMLVLWILGAMEITGMNSWLLLLPSLMGALLAGFMEEILVRGILFRIIEESLGTWIALAVSAAIFGLLHIFNPGATLVSTIAIALEAGILLAAVYAYTRRLWMVIALHAAWNFTEGGIFGASVSGGAGHGLFISRFHGAELLTGGKFGPEASLPAVLICLAAGIVFLMLAYRKGNFVQPVWHRRRKPHTGHTLTAHV